MNKTQDRKTMLFAAGGLTGLIGVTVLVLGLGIQDLAFGASAAQPSVSVEETPVASMSAPLPEVVVAPTTAPVAATSAVTIDATGGLQQVLDQNAQLRQALQLMQQREEVYRQQLEEASQTILSMAAQPVTGAVASQEAGSMPSGSVDASGEFTDEHVGAYEESEHEDTEHEREHDAEEHNDD